jgi:hypothetical protein
VGIGQQVADRLMKGLSSMDITKFSDKMGMLNVFPVYKVMSCDLLRGFGTFR